MQVTNVPLSTLSASVDSISDGNKVLAPFQHLPCLVFGIIGDLCFP